MDNKKPNSFVIPKKRKAEVPVQELVAEETASSSSSPDIPEGYEFKELSDIESAKFLVEIEENPKDHGSSSEESWKRLKATKVELIKNPKLEKDFEAYKIRTKLDREVFRFRVAYSQTEVEEVAESGLSVRSDTVIDIGDRRQGVMVYKTAASSYPGRFFFTNVPITVMVFRVVEGKRSEIPISSGIVAPSKKHNCHVLMKTDGLSKYNQFTLDRILSGVFYYEYFENTMELHEYPGMILPHAVITYMLPADTLVNNQMIEKQSKIHKYSLSFLASDVCAHTIIMPGSPTKHDGSLAIPSITEEVVYFLRDEEEASTSIFQLKHLQQLPELDVLRYSPSFGKLLSKENVFVSGFGSYAHYVLKFVCPQPFIEKLQKHNSILVWNRDEEWTVFYLPTGRIAAEFGFPPQENSFHMIVHRINQEDEGLGAKNILLGDSEVFDQTPFWNIEDDSERTPFTGEEFNEEVDDCVESGEEGFEQHSSPSTPGTPLPFPTPDHSVPSPSLTPDTQSSSLTLNIPPPISHISVPSPSPILQESSFSPSRPPPTPGFLEKSVDVGFPAPPIKVNPNFVLKSILRKQGYKPKEMRIGFNDLAYDTRPNHKRGPLTCVREFNKDDDSSRSADYEKLTFAEKMKNEHMDEANRKIQEKEQLDEEKKERAAKGTDELFKNAMSSSSGGNSTQPADCAPSTSTSIIETNIPPPGYAPVASIAPSTSSPTQPVTTFGSFSTPPPPIHSPLRIPPPGIHPPVAHFHPNVPPPSFVPIGVPPPNFTSCPPPNLKTIQSPVFAPQQPSLPVLPPSIPNMNRPPPPVTHPVISMNARPIAAPGLIVPTSLSIPPPAQVTKIPSPKKPGPSAMKTNSPILLNLSQSNCSPNPPRVVGSSQSSPIVSSALVEIGEEPMDIDDDDEDKTIELVDSQDESVEETGTTVSEAEHVELQEDDPDEAKPQEEPNDILQMAFAQAPAPCPAPVQLPPSIPIIPAHDPDEIRRILSNLPKKSPVLPGPSDTDLRNLPRPVAFSINKKPLATKANVLMGNDDDDDEEEEMEPKDKHARTSQDSDYRASSLNQNRISQESFPRDRDDRQRDKDDRVRTIPLQTMPPKEVQQLVDKTLGDKLMNGSTMIKPAMDIAAQGFGAMFPHVARSNMFGPKPAGIVTPTVTPSTSSSIVLPENPHGYEPKSILNSQQPQRTTSTEIPQDVNYAGEGPSSSNTKRRGSSKKKPKDFDSVQRESSDARVQAAWMSTVTTTPSAPMASDPSTNQQQKPIEYITLDSDDEIEEGELFIDAPPLAPPPGIISRRGMQNTPSRGRYVNQGPQHPARGRGGFRGGFTPRGNHQYQNYHNGNKYAPQQQSTTWKDQLEPIKDALADNYTIYLDPHMHEGNMSPKELDSLFKVLLDLKKVQAPTSPRIHSTIYIHELLLKDMEKKTKDNKLAKYYHPFSTYMHSQPPLVEALPPHISCLSRLVSNEVLSKCLQEVHKYRNSIEAIFLTHAFTEDSPEGQKFAQKGIKVMRIRELGDYIGNRTGDPINFF